jgi:hypothetical protein
MDRKVDFCTMSALPLRLALLALLLAGTLALPASAAVAPTGEGGAPYLDVRDGAQAETVAEQRTAGDAPAGQERAADALVGGQGPQATLDLDPTTGTVRSLVDLSGALTGPSGEAPRDIALAYVREHRVALGLTDADLDTLRLESEATSPEGLTVVRWHQEIDGVEVFDNGLTASVDRAGRLLSLGGSPLHAPDPNAAAPDLSAGDALNELRDSVGQPGGRQVSAPQRTYFDVNGTLRLAWRLVWRASPTAVYDAAVDAKSGRVLHRANLVKFAVDVNVFPHYPGAATGGSQVSVDIGPFLTSATTLSGPYAYTYADLDDDDKADPGEDVAPTLANSTFNSTYTLQPHGVCLASAKCSWDHTVGSSWTANKNQNAIQAFWFVNQFRNHLAAAPISFDAASGAFESGDRVIVNSDDGADTGTNHLPSSSHRNNANMYTPADGESPLMQMYLFSNSSGWFRDINGGDAASIVFHEYTHGLSSRLIHHPSGVEALDSAQAGAMGEAWSDWYAMDFLNRGDAAPKGMGAVMVPDTGAPGEVDLGEYTDAVPNAIRTQPLDCPVGASAAACPGSGTAGSGGYTYRDFGRICGCGPEVHADGEIWAETLWDLRAALIASLGSVAQGADAAEQLVTDGIRLSPPEPSFLDMRNAIVLAAGVNANYRNIVWNVFAHRGMGYFAGAIDGTDVTPAEDFSLPPAPDAATGTLTGRVSEVGNGHPVAGAKVLVGGHTNGESVYTATTGSDGRYTLAGLPAGTYGKVFVLPADGYDGVMERNVTVSGSGTSTLDFAVKHNWASAAGGGSIFADTDTYYTKYDCGPAALIDGDQANGWSAWNPTSPRYPTPTEANHLVAGQPPTATIQLARTVDITGFAGDPGTTCGDDSGATTRTFRIETSPNATNWTTAYDGTSASTDFDPGDAGTLKLLAPTAGTQGVRYVRLTLIAPQAATESGVDFIDFSEFAVYGNGVPTAALSVPATAQVGDTVALDASGSADDGSIASYAWDYDGDGTIDGPVTTDPVANHKYERAGTFKPRVIVTDDGGSTAAATATIVVGGTPDNAGGTPTTTTDPGSGPTGGGTSSGSGTTTTPTDPGTTTTTPQQPADTTQPTTSEPPPAPQVALLSTGRLNGLSVRLHCGVACNGTAALKISARTARRLGLRSRTISRIAIKAAAGTTTIRLSVKRSVLRRLRSHRVRSLHPALALTVKDAFGRSARLAGLPPIRVSRR